MTFNVRYDNPDDGQNAWPLRKERVARVMERATLVGVQEALYHQVLDLDQMLDGYDWVGVGRDDGMQKGEFAPIFYRLDTFELLDTGTFWLSATPEVPGSKSWDAAITRLTTWGLFRLHDSHDSLWVFNTHFDHRGEQARQNSAQLLVSRIAEIAGRGMVVVTGDFNASPETQVYATMTTGSLVDTRQASRVSPVGPEGTFSGFETGKEPLRGPIDYVFVTRSLEVLSYEALVDVENGHYVSDHLPVRVVLRLDQE